MVSKKEEFEDEQEDDENLDEKLEQRTKVLYELMGVEKTATPEEIKKAYRKLALMKHPDKCPDDPKAADNFQKLNRAYEILKDPKKRARYDEYGDDGTGDGDVFATDDWLEAYDFYRQLHPEIQKADIKSFAEQYRGSTEEQEDLLDFYEEHEGDLTFILESIMLSRNEDLTRFIDFYEQKIKEKIIEHYPDFDKTKTAIKMLPDEKAEAKKLKQKLKKKKEKENAGGDMADLQKMILAKREGAFNSFLKNLETKYCNEDEDQDEVDFSDEEKSKPTRKRKLDQNQMPKGGKRIKK